MVCRSTATQFTTGEGDMDMFSRGFARGSYTTMEPRWDNRGTASRVRLGFGSCPPPPFPPAPPFPHPPLIDGRTIHYAGGKGSDGDTQSWSLPHSHAILAPVAKPPLWVGLPCAREQCARLPSTIARSPFGGKQENVRVRALSSPANGNGYVPTPIPALGAGCLSLKRSRTFLFTRSLSRQGGEDCSPYRVEVFLETFRGHSFLGAGTGNGNAQHQKPHPSAPRFCFAHCFSFVPRCRRSGRRAGGKYAHL